MSALRLLYLRRSLSTAASASATFRRRSRTFSCVAASSAFFDASRDMREIRSIPPTKSAELFAEFAESPASACQPSDSFRALCAPPLVVVELVVVPVVPASTTLIFSVIWRASSTGSRGSRSPK